MTFFIAVAAVAAVVGLSFRIYPYHWIHKYNTVQHNGNNSTNNDEICADSSLYTHLVIFL